MTQRPRHWRRIPFFCILPLHTVNMSIRLLAALLLLSLASYSQSNFEILFKSGNYLPEQNLERLTRDRSMLAPYVHGKKYLVAIQFNAIPNDETRSGLTKLGIQLIDYLPNFAYTAMIPVQTDFRELLKFNIRAVFPLQAEHKVPAIIQPADFPQWAVKAKGMVDLTVIAFDNIFDLTSESFLKSYNAQLLSAEPTFRTITVRVPFTSYDQLLISPLVQWVETVSPDPVEENLPGKNLHRSNVLNDGPSNLTGNGVRIGIWDGGQVGPHNDFAGRLTIVENVASDNHATHVAGTMAGAGLLDPVARGMAPQAQVYSYDFNGAVSTEVASAITTYSIVMTQNSWGSGDGFVNCTTRDPYTSNSRSQDINIQNNPHLMHVHSSGNSQSVCSGGWGTTTGKAAKNTLVVANVTSSELLSSSSSCGPVQDGRLKPEISGLGTDVYSTTPQNTYTGGYSGTSMATPGISGTIAQLYQRYRQLNSNSNPISSLLKALVCNNAKDLGNAGPDFRFGYGRINGLQALRALEDNRFVINSVSNSATNSTTITIPSGAGRLKVMLCWVDPAAATNANPALVNNLNLFVLDPTAAAINPWVLDPALPGNAAVRGIDSRNNIEQVTIDNPAAGTYTIAVNGVSVASGPQQYAITWTIEQPYIEVTFPNGGEKLTPGSSYTIAWDEYGITSNLTVQYSLNNGSSWTNISTSVAAGVNRLSWTVPSTFTASALVRVTSGAISDQSDATFSILGVPTVTATTECAALGAVRVSWTSVTNATHYDVLQLDTVSGVWNTVLTNLTTTNGTVSGLVQGRRYWFTTIAKNNTNSIVGERAIAKSAFASSAIATPAQPGTISGSTSLCEGAVVTYSIAAVSLATSYTWTVPTGSVIQSGQGTTSITVLIGTTSGNISVTASNSCGTSAARTLAVTVAIPPTPPEITFTNSNTTTINDNVAATPFPTQINATGLIGTISRVRVRINNLSHTWKGDIDMLLESPSGQRIMLMSDCGEVLNSTVVNLTFDRNVSNLTSSNPVTSGTFLPTNYNSPDNFTTLGSITANIGTASTGLTSYNGENPNGDWKLYVMDDASGDVGSFPSWELRVTTNSFNISGNTNVCANLSGVVYSCPTISNAVTYSWTVPSGATIVSGANTNSITVDFGPAAVSGNVSVSVSNSCGTISSEALAVTVEAPTVASVTITSDQVPGSCSSTPILFTAAPVNGGITPAYQWQVNNVNTGTGGPTFTASALPSGSIVRCIMTSSASCASGSPATSNQISVSYGPTCAFAYSVTVYIQGFYRSASQMAAVAHPTTAPLLTDSLSLSLATATIPFVVTNTINGTVSTNGTAQFLIPDSMIGMSRYLIIRHRNSLETWSASPVILSATTGYSFADAASAALGNNLSDLGGGKFGLWSGDVDQDGRIDDDDWILIQSACTDFISGYEPEDLTGDWLVESQDFSMIENNLGKMVVRP